MEISAELRDKILESVGKIRADLRFFTGPDSEGPERELEDHKVGADLVAFDTSDGAALISFRTVAEAWIPWTPPTVARFMDVYLDGRRISRVDLARLFQDQARGQDIYVPPRAQFTLDVIP